MRDETSAARSAKPASARPAEATQVRVKPQVRVEVGDTGATEQYRRFVSRLNRARDADIEQAMQRLKV